MCELCSNPEAGRKSATRMAERLEHLAANYRRLANGTLDPHSEASRVTGVMARNIVRNLVEEWV